MHVEGELYLWMVLLRVVIVGASNLFVPPTCQESSRVIGNLCYGQQFKTEASLSVQYETGLINVTVSGTNLVGGLLAYGCNSTDNETCTVIRKGTVYLRSTSLAVVLSAGTQCVFFGCYTKQLDYSWYQFKPVTLTIPPVSISKGALSTTVPQATSSSPEPVMLLMSTNSSVPGMIRPAITLLAIVTGTGAVTMSSGLTEDGSSNITIIIIIALLAFTVMVVLAVVGALVCAFKLRKKCRNDRLTIEWSDEDYKPVKIAFTANISCSISTIIDSLEKPQAGPADHQLLENPNDSVIYLKTSNLRSPEIDTQTTDLPVILSPSV